MKNDKTKKVIMLLLLILIYVGAAMIKFLPLTLIALFITIAIVIHEKNKKTS